MPIVYHQLLLNEKLHSDTLLESRIYDDTDDRIKLFMELIPHLSRPERLEMLETILIITRETSLELKRAQYLTKLALYISGPERDEIFREALAIVWKIK
jgi:hypothetical protein